MPDADEAMTYSESIAYYVQRGWVVEHSTAEWTSLTSGNDANHILHLILTALTGCLWLPVWAVVAWTRRPRKIMLYADGRSA